jgi:hypothetical protein
MRTVYALLWLIAVVLILSATIFAGTYSGGTGTETDPFRIQAVQDLQELSQTPDDFAQNFVLTSDIDLSGLVMDRPLISYDMEPTQWGFQGPQFTGSFNGQNHSISNVRVVSPEGNYVSFFGRLGRTGSIRNLHLRSVEIHGFRQVSGLVAECDGLVSDCSVEGVLSGQEYVGGLIAYQDHGNVLRCKTQVFITAGIQIYQHSGMIGGLIGATNKGVVQESGSDCTIRNHNQTVGVGGLLGTNSGLVQSCWVTCTLLDSVGAKSLGAVCGSSSGTITQCVAAAVRIESVGTGVGGFVGMNDGLISQCIAYGDIQGNTECGGLVGTNRGSVIDCYAMGTVNGLSAPSGFVGSNQWGILRSYYVAADSQETVRMVGQNSGVISLSYYRRPQRSFIAPLDDWAKTNNEMMLASTFIGWGDDIWVLLDGQDYPRLKWEGTAGASLRDAPGIFGGGKGTPEDPYVISSPDQFLAIGNYPQDLHACYRLETDIDLGGREFDGVGFGSGFGGVFDGNHHRIQNYRQSRNMIYSGFFPMIHPKGEVANLNLSKAILIGHRNIGILAGKNQGTIRNCSVQGLIQTNSDKKVESRRIGGFVGENDGQIECSRSQILIRNMQNSTRMLGGFVGYNRGLVEQCMSEGMLVAEGGSCQHFGGFVGEAFYDSIIRNCLSSVTVKSLGKYDYAMGGFAGFQGYRSKIICSISVGAIEVNPYSQDYGGFVGINSQLDNPDSEIANCFWDIQTSKIDRGFSKNTEPRVSLQGLSSSPLQRIDPYAESKWDIRNADQEGSSVWIITEGEYPKPACFARVKP